MGNCPKCNEEIQEGWRYCPQCGTLTKTVEDIIREEVRKAEKRVLAIVLKFHEDKDFREMAYMLSKLDDEQLSIVSTAMDKLKDGVPTEQVVAETQEEIAKLNAERAKHRR